MPERPPFLVTPPAEGVARLPLVIDSPHSGMTWPAEFAPTASRAAILTTWDAHVDELFGDAPAAGATLLAATFPRAFVDVNRAADDIDPELLAEPWPTPLTPTAYTQRGMGLIRRNALPDVPMYDRPLTLDAVRHRIAYYYEPYRAELDRLVRAAHVAFGAAWHLNCHSMKSRGNAMNVDDGAARPDVVVSDRNGTTADPAFRDWIGDWFRSRGWSVSLNTPYQGGDLVRSVGRPADGVHSIQIEINRARYLDESLVQRGTAFNDVRRTCASLVRDFGALVLRDVAARSSK